MRHLCAALILAAGLTSAFETSAEPSRTLAVTTFPAAGNASALLGQPYVREIPRYKKSGILGMTEYDSVNCTFTDSGYWDNFTPVNPENSGIIWEQPFEGTIVGGPCDGLAVTYAAIYFTWEARNNKTAISGEGPLATFDARWKTNDGLFDVPWEFKIYVPIVRPIGETSTLVDWFGGPRSGVVGRWTGTLKPPENDKDFDFGGERVKEEFIHSTDSCAARAPGILGKEGQAGAVPSAKEGGWIVGQIEGKKAGKNVYGFDKVGWQVACPVFAYRCAGVAFAGCETRLAQGVRIKSPADKDFSEVLYRNVLGEGISGGVLNDTPKIALGEVMSRRGDGGIEHLPFQTDETTCSALVIENLKKFPGSCYAP